MMEDAIRVVLVDDHNMVRMGLKAYFSTLPDIQVVGEAATGEEAVRLAADLVPDVVLMDLIMPGMDGIETTRQIKKSSPRTQIVVLTSFHDDDHIFPALKAGAISYILKDMKMEKLVEALHRAINGEITLHPLVATRVLQNLRGEHGEEQSFYADLTERELDVLRLLALGLSNADIAQRLFLSEGTIRNYVSAIFAKLGVTDRTQAAVLALRSGLGE